MAKKLRLVNNTFIPIHFSKSPISLDINRMRHKCSTIGIEIDDIGLYML